MWSLWTVIMDVLRRFYRLAADRIRPRKVPALDKTICPSRYARCRSRIGAQVHLGRHVEPSPSALVSTPKRVHCMIGTIYP